MLEATAAHSNRGRIRWSFGYLYSIIYIYMHEISLSEVNGKKCIVNFTSVNNPFRTIPKGECIINASEKYIEG